MQTMLADDELTLPDEVGRMTADAALTYCLSELSDISELSDFYSSDSEDDEPPMETEAEWSQMTGKDFHDCSDAGRPHITTEAEWIERFDNNFQECSGWPEDTARQRRRKQHTVKRIKQSKEAVLRDLKGTKKPKPGWTERTE